MPRSKRAVSRREFTLAVAAAPLAAAGASAAENDAELSPDEALLAIVRDRYGKHLTAEQLKAIHRGIQRMNARAETLKRYPLHNGDDPAVAFRADLP
jgi:hypothetical protein